jgi:uncharacterized protein (TIGR02996 family)
MADDPEAALLAAVHEDPNDFQARAIYADWLEERGDPRGEYLRLDMQLVSLPARLADLIARIDPQWIHAVDGRCSITITAIGPNKIAAIKTVREITGLGLKDAKDLVESVSPTHRVILKDDLDRDTARDILAKCQESMTVAVTPRLPEKAPSAPSGPRGYLRPYHVLLVGVTDRLAVIQEIHKRYARTLVDARTIVDQVVAGQPFTLAIHLDGTTAAELAVAFGKLGTVRIEHSA